MTWTVSEGHTRAKTKVVNFHMNTNKWLYSRTWHIELNFNAANGLKQKVMGQKCLQQNNTKINKNVNRYFKDVGLQIILKFLL